MWPRGRPSRGKTAIIIRRCGFSRPEKGKSFRPAGHLQTDICCQGRPLGDTSWYFFGPLTCWVFGQILWRTGRISQVVAPRPGSTKEADISQCLDQVSYTAESLAAQIKKPEDRLEVVAKVMADAAGAKILGGGYSGDRP